MPERGPLNRWLVNSKKWLLIVDNVDHLTLLESKLPTSPHGDILVTSRFKHLEKLGIQKTHQLDTFTQRASEEFLIKRTESRPLGRTTLRAHPSNVLFRPIAQGGL